MNIDKHVHYWTTTSDEDWDVAVDLVERGKVRHGMFFLHLAMEKLLKGHVCRHTKQVPPKSHDLTRLIELAELEISSEWLALLGRMNAFCMTGRYPEDLANVHVSQDVANRYMRELREMRSWLQKKLSNP